MAKGFIKFILDCETEGGGVLLRDYLAIRSYEDLKLFFGKNRYYIEEEELKDLWIAKNKAEHISIDYKYINGPGKSY